MDESSTSKAQHLSQISFKHKGWACFEESPVHVQPPNANTFAANQTSWEGVHDSRWTNFESSDKNLHTNFTSNQHSGLELSDNVNNSANPSQPSSLSNSTNLSPPSAISHPTSNQTASLDADNHLKISTREDSDHVGSTHSSEPGSDCQDPWCITTEQREYYMNQFTSMQPDIEGKIDGSTARDFFTKSNLPIVELSHVWELSDMDKDGRLSLDEFCIAFHLVVARMKKFDLPSQLPQTLVPTLIDIQVGDEEPQVTDPQGSGKRVDQWETFSDRTASSTTLANFDQVPDSNQDIHHPIAQRMTPSRHQEHWSKMESANLKVETLDEESATSSPQTHTKKHHSLTNPYECLKNDFSGPDSSDLERHRARSSSVSSSSSCEPPGNRADPSVSENVFKRSMHAGASVDVTVTTRRSVSSDDEKPHDEHSDHDHSDWASRPLRPRSSSNSSEDSVAMPSIAAPQPPPRPQIQVHSTISPLPKPRSSAVESQSLKTLETFSSLQDSEMRFDGPTPPPRPTVSKADSSPVEQASFADFSNFSPISPKSDPANPSISDTVKTKNSKSMEKKELKREVTSKAEKLPTPAPRPQKKAVKSSGSETKMRRRDVISASSKKAPTKPPRSRIMSADMIRSDHVMSSLVTSRRKDDVIASAVKEKFVKRKSVLQTSIRDLKSRNTQLSRLNADLQQQLKDVMETRITVEMAIHQMRPFSN